VVPVLSIVCLVAGTAFAWAATRHPALVATFERCGGALLVTGLVLVGTGLRPC
jgi:hypothetical protein